VDFFNQTWKQVCFSLIQDFLSDTITIWPHITEELSMKPTTPQRDENG
jgi:hypothetical protein